MTAAELKGLENFPVEPLGAEGPAGSRPHQKQLEAKDVIKMSSAGMSMPGRIAAPRGMMLGGGSSDYAFRGGDSKVKRLLWDELKTTITGDSSFVRTDTYLYGPLSDLFNNLGQDAESPAPVGVPVEIATIQKSMGAFHYRMRAFMTYTAEAVLRSNQIGAFIYGNLVAGPPVGNKQIELTLQSGAALSQTNMATDGTLEVMIDWHLTPPRKADIGVGGVTKDSIRVTVIITTKHCNSVVTSVGLSAAGAQLYINRRNAEFYINTQQSQQRIWLDAGFRSDAADANIIINLYESSGVTMSGHDGYPYDIAIKS